MNINAIRISLSIIILLCLSSVLFAQKTVHVREYKRKDGTVVRAHDRRPPGSSKRSTPAPISDTPQPVDSGGEPYEVVDLGHGSFYTPGGTGVIRPRIVGPIKGDEGRQ